MPRGVKVAVSGAVRGRQTLHLYRLGRCYYRILSVTEHMSRGEGRGKGDGGT